MQSYSYQMLNGYPVLQIEGLSVLLNTGSEQSMGKVKQLYLDGEDFPLHPSTLRTFPDDLGRQLGFPMDAMLGADILSRFDYKVLSESGQMVFTHGEFRPYGYANHFDLYLGVPINPVSIFNQDMRLFFSTGSRRTCLTASLLRDLPSFGLARDYYPGLGTFETPLYRILVWVAGYDVELEAGLSPDPLTSMLKETGSQGILGADVFQGFEVCLAPRRREGFWWRRGFRREEVEGQRRDPNDVPGYYY